MPLRLLACVLILLLTGSTAVAQPLERLTTVVGPSIQKTADGLLGLMGFLVVPDMAASSIQINRSSNEGDTGLALTQIGSGFTVDPESFPLYMEGFLGFSRYDPRFILSDGKQETRLPVRWNSLALSGGLGWDIRLAENLVLRPMLNIALGHVESDISLAARYLTLKTDYNFNFLKRGNLNSYGYGGAMVLDYGIYREGYELDIELRYTQLELRNIPGHFDYVARGQATPKTVGLWSRFRLPTPYEVFTRPLRTVFELSHSRFFGEEARAMGFNYMTKIGGGLEVDIGRYELGGLGLYAQRARIMGSVVTGPHVNGFGFGLGVSF